MLSSYRSLEGLLCFEGVSHTDRRDNCWFALLLPFAQIVKLVLTSLKALWITLSGVTKSLHTSRSHCLKILLKYFDKRSVLTSSSAHIWNWAAKPEARLMCSCRRERNELWKSVMYLPLLSQPTTKPQFNFQPLLLLFWVAPPTSAASQFQLC